MTRRSRFLSCALALFLAAGTAALGPSGAGATEEDERLGSSGLPLPRFVSLRSGEVNLRTGPGRRYPIDWIYQRRGLPVQIIDEFEAWRRVRDHQGAVGWIHRSMLAGRRTVVVVDAPRLLHQEPDGTSAGIAYLEAGVIAGLEGCLIAWCRVDAERFDGWLRRDGLYGIGPDD